MKKDNQILVRNRKFGQRCTRWLAGLFFFTLLACQPAVEPAVVSLPSATVSHKTDLEGGDGANEVADTVPLTPPVVATDAPNVSPSATPTASPTSHATLIPTASPSPVPTAIPILQSAIDLHSYNCQVEDLYRPNDIPYFIKGESEEILEEFKAFGSILDYHQVAIGESSLTYTTAYCTIVLMRSKQEAQSLLFNFCMEFIEGDVAFGPDFDVGEEACIDDWSGVVSLAYRVKNAVVYIQQDLNGLDLEILATTVADRLTQLPLFELDCPSGLGDATLDECAEAGDPIPPLDPNCHFGDLAIPENAVVYAAGGYEGRELTHQIDQSGHTATQFDIEVNNTSLPSILILGAYEPTIWNIAWTAGSEITAVFVSGYHRQVVAGLPADVPLLISSYEDGGICDYFIVDSGRETPIELLSAGLFDKPVETFLYGDHDDARLVMGNPIPAGAELVTSVDSPPEQYFDADAPLAGQAGLDDAVAKGIIRPATVEDIDRWVAATSPETPLEEVTIGRYGYDDLLVEIDFLGRVYVVLAPLTYPNGLYGANLAIFFIEEGVPLPDGDSGHSDVFDFNTLSCVTPFCD